MSRELMEYLEEELVDYHFQIFNNRDKIVIERDDRLVVTVYKDYRVDTNTNKFLELSSSCKVEVLGGVYKAIQEDFKNTEKFQWVPKDKSKFYKYKDGTVFHLIEGEFWCFKNSETYGVKYFTEEDFWCVCEDLELDFDDFKGVKEC